MRLYFDLNQNQLSTIKGVIRAPRIELKRRDVAALEVVPVRDGLEEALETGATPFFGVKPKNRLDADFIVFTEAFTGPDSGMVYRALLNMHTEALNTLFALESEKIEDLYAEFGFTTLAGEQTSSQYCKTIIYNDLYRGTEGTVVPGNPSYPPSGQVLVISPIDELTGGGDTALDNVRTAEGLMSAGKQYEVLLAACGATARYRLRAGTDAESLPWIVRPNDYGVANQVVWELRGVWRNGAPCIWNPTTSKFHEMVAIGDPPQMSLTVPGFTLE